MARKSTKTLSFSDKLKKASASVYKDIRFILIAKNEYLMKNRDNILNAYKVGHTFPVIAEVATKELLATDVPKTYSWVNKENEKKEGTTKFTAGEIKKFCEENQG